MQVILVKPVRKLGKVGEIVSVKDGFGRNYLIPQDLAIRATEDNIAQFASQKKEMEVKNTESKGEAEIAAKALTGKHLTYITQAAADGRLFGSVSAKSIAQELSTLTNLELNYSSVLLSVPIKFTGVYNVDVVLHPDVLSNITIVIAKSESEAQDALRDFREGKKSEDAAENSAEETIAE